MADSSAQRSANPRNSGLATGDAVVIVPGIMGSELYDTELDRPIWGLRPGWYARAWSPFGAGMTPLALTEEELSGNTGRVRATALLSAPAFAPLFAGVEPYTALVAAVRKLTGHASAVLEFPYDWRLPVAHNAPLLATAVQGHLARWRRTSGRTDAGVVIVAHSMGGLVCNEMAAIPGAVDGVRMILTLGTPFDGAAKAAVLLGSGEGSAIPLPRQRLRAVAVTMPGLYDLLPVYRCVDEGDSARRLAPGDVARLGGRADLAGLAFDGHAQRAAVRLPGHRSLVGTEQPTVSSITLADGLATGHPHAFEPGEDGELVRDMHGALNRRQAGGDGTVPRNSAQPRHGVQPAPLPQQHTTLAQSSEAIAFVRDFLLHGRILERPRLGAGDVGLSLPDIVTPGVEWDAALTGIDAQQAQVTVTDVETGVQHRAVTYRRGQTVRAAVTVPTPGLYRVRVSGGTVPVSQLVLACPSDEHA